MARLGRHGTSHPGCTGLPHPPDQPPSGTISRLPHSPAERLCRSCDSQPMLFVTLQSPVPPRVSSIESPSQNPARLLIHANSNYQLRSAHRDGFVQRQQKKMEMLSRSLFQLRRRYRTSRRAGTGLLHHRSQLFPAVVRLWLPDPRRQSTLRMCKVWPLWRKEKVEQFSRGSFS